MSSKISLSYVLTTYNKLLYLKEVMKRLIENCQEDEEIVVTDGGSTDGTPEYLQALFSQGKIHQYISEKDFGEAHGFNKGFLMAKGELIKVITDDDSFYYPHIQLCKKFMISRPKIDVLSTSGAATDWNKTENDFFFKMGIDYEANFQKWLVCQFPFTFCGLGLMLRKSSLPLIGLFNTNIVRVDYEFGMRVTSGKINLAWYTGNCYVRVSNPHSNSVNMGDKMIEEEIKLNNFYLNISLETKDIHVIEAIPSYKLLKNNLRRFKRLLHKITPNFNKGQNKVAQNIPNLNFTPDWVAIYNLCDQWLAKENVADQGNFLYK